MGNSIEASKLCSKGLRFGGALKVVNKYWEAGPSSIYMSCAGIGHDCLGECQDKAIQCVICTSAHKTENHRCGVTGCILKMGKLCTQVIPKYANCGGSYKATAFKCPARLKAQAEAWKAKAKKSKVKEKQPTIYPTSKEKPAIYAISEEEPVIRSVKIELDIVVTLWTRNSKQQFSQLSLF